VHSTGIDDMTFYEKIAKCKLKVPSWHDNIKPCQLKTIASLYCIMSSPHTHLNRLKYT